MAFAMRMEFTDVVVDDSLKNCCVNGVKTGFQFEIRLAYYFDGEKTVPVTGISMSGKLSEALAGVKLDEKVTVDGAYEGPRRLLIRNMAIL